MNSLQPKTPLKSKTLWITIVVVFLIVLFGILQNYGIKMPDWVSVAIASIASIFIGSEKLKDGKLGAIKVLTADKKDVLAIDNKAIVNENVSKYMIGAGVLLNTIIGILDANGIQLSPTILGAINLVIGIFVGFDKYKEAKIKAAHDIQLTQLKNTKKKRRG